jgi:hypothetical protein
MVKKQTHRKDAKLSKKLINKKQFKEALIKSPVRPELVEG